MTLIDAILKANTIEGGSRTSPPPEAINSDICKKNTKKYVHKVSHNPSVRRVAFRARLKEPIDHHRRGPIRADVQPELRGKRNEAPRPRPRAGEGTGGFLGRVDSHWKNEPVRFMQYYQSRVDFLKKTRRQNLALHKRIMNADPKIVPTAELNRDWARNRRKIVDQAARPFLLFPPIIPEEIEDPAFVAPLNVKRPRVYITLGIKDGAEIGEICVELFTDTCPKTCNLFLELLDGDAHGYGYINTCFYR
ncbi:unnamed protein product [Spodoptera exigua]|nr:unnamed protein product [Spodoptera exigua]